MGDSYNNHKQTENQSQGDENPSGIRQDAALLQALNKASATLQRSAHNAKDFFRGFCKQVLSLGFHGSLCLLNETGTVLFVKALAYPSSLIPDLEEITGLTETGFSFPVEKIDAIKEVIKGRISLYREKNTQVITGIFSEHAGLFSGKILKAITGSPVIYAPLISAGKTIGILIIESRNLKKKDIPVIETFANHIAVILDNLCLLERLKENETKLSKQTEDSGLINELNAAINIGKPLYKIFSLLAEETRRIFPCKGVALYVYDPNNNELSLQNMKRGTIITASIEQLTGVSTWKLKVRPDKLFDVILKNKSLYLMRKYGQVKQYIEEFIESIDFPDISIRKKLREFTAQICGMMNINSIIIFPMIEGEDIIGIIEILKEEEFSDEEIRRLETISGQVTTAVKRKQNQDQLQKLSHAINQSPSMIVITDINGNIEYVNSKFSEVTGYSFKEVYGRHARLLKSGKTSPAQYAYLWQTISSGGEWRGEFYNRKKDGGFYWEEANISPIRDEMGEIIHYLAVKNDITENKKIEQELFKAKKLESIGILAGGIAHDFNNLLSGILGNISLAKIHVDKEQTELMTLLTEAETASLNAKDLTQQILTFSKGGSPVKKSVSLINLIEETVRFALRGSNIKWEFHHPDDLWPVEIDKGQISQVINNLVINADQAMEKGGKLTITAKNSFISDSHFLPLKKGEYIILSFQDNGIGIPEQNITKVFDPYFTTKKNGNGLGLATAYSMIKKHGGIILVESTVNAGSTFYVYLPATDKPISGKGPDVKRELPGATRVLIMDDEELVRRVAAKMLKHLGCVVTEVKDGDEAVCVYKKSLNTKNKFDLVIMDLTIPGGTGGKETVKKLREIDPGVKVIVSSGYSNNPTAASYKRHGFDGVVNKPYKLNELEDALKHVLCPGDEQDGT